jgi:hypothetical protein
MERSKFKAFVPCLVQSYRCRTVQGRRASNGNPKACFVQGVGGFQKMSFYWLLRKKKKGQTE